MYKGLVGCDFLVTFYKPHSDFLDEEQMRTLMYHELRHIGYNPNTERSFIVPHEVEDFLDIIRKYGPCWCEADMDDDEV